jgi:hypothetical protein
VLSLLKYPLFVDTSQQNMIDPGAADLPFSSGHNNTSTQDYAIVAALL